MSPIDAQIVSNNERSVERKLKITTRVYAYIEHNFKLSDAMEISGHDTPGRKGDICKSISLVQRMKYDRN